MHIGLPPTANLKDIIDRMLSAKSKKGIPPVHVRSGPCKEVKIEAKDVDLTRLPVPRLNKADGGDYIQTMGINIVQHPTEDWTNWSIARAMIHDKNRMAGLIMKVGRLVLLPCMANANPPPSRNTSQDFSSNGRSLVRTSRSQ
jgi:UbiD family decarboxylase